MLTAQYQTGEYLEKVPDWHAGDAPWKARQILRLLERNRVAPESVCDVGCGAGEILVQLQPRLRGEPRLTGYDISGQAIALCQPKENARLRFHRGDFLQGREGYDLLLLLDVLEHVPDYLGFLAALRPRARRFVFHVPLDWSVQAVAEGSRYPLSMRERYGHLHFFTAETALRAIRDAGYRVEDAFHTWDHDLEQGFPPVQPGLRARLKYPLRCLRYGLERLAFQSRPALTARLRPHYNLLVLASAEG